MVRLDKLNESWVFTIIDDNGSDPPDIHAIGKKAYPTKEECFEAISNLFMLMGKSVKHTGTTAEVEIYNSIDDTYHRVEIAPELEDHSAEYE